MPRLTSSARSLKHGSQATRRKACATWQKRGAKGGDFWQSWDWSYGCWYIYIYIYIWIYVDLGGFMWIYVDWLAGIDYMDLRSAPIYMYIYICWDHQNNSPLTSRSLAKRGSWRDQVVGMCGQLVSGTDGCKGCKQPETMGIGWWDMMGMAWFG